ncbi:MAG: hypothetical protein IT567_06980 [Alphaproteobacteria bacterium]|nr:hypothetical protein [Alphaproteobacteria bacterium]
MDWTPWILLGIGVLLLLAAGLLFLPLHQRASFYQKWVEKQRKDGWPTPPRKDGDE